MNGAQSSMSQQFEHQLAFGKLAEGTIERWLIHKKKYAILSVYDIAIRNNKGPRLLTPVEDLIAPDILAFCNHEVRWIEAKHKSYFSWHRITQRWVTGIDIRCYEDYQQIAQETGLPVWLLFLHSNSHSPEGECPVGLFGSPLSHLIMSENHRSQQWGRKGMVYWAHSALMQLATIEELIPFSKGN